MFTRRLRRDKSHSKSMDEEVKGAEKAKRVDNKSITKSKKKDKSHSSSRKTKTATALDKKNLAKLQKSLAEQQQQQLRAWIDTSSPIVTLYVGSEGRLFAAHEHVLRQSAVLDRACRDFPPEEEVRKISLRQEEAEVFSAVLEYLYTGDYYPRLLSDKGHTRWELEDSVLPASSSSPSSSSQRPDATVFLSSVGTTILRDTAIYCAAARYGLERLKLLALRKQDLRTGVDAVTLLKSAQYAYENTPDSDSRLRAHYLALIIRFRKAFKRSGTMQAEMEAGGSRLFFDLFVALCNHLDDVMDVTVPRGRSPK